MTDYKASKRIVGTSAEREPYNIGSGWTTLGSSGKVTESGAIVTYTIDGSSQNSGVYKALPATAGTSWVLRYKLDITTDNISFGSGQAGNHLVSITNGTSGFGEGTPTSSYSMTTKHTYHADKKVAQYWTNGSTDGNDWNNGITITQGVKTRYVTITNNAGSLQSRYATSSDYTGGDTTSAWSVNSSSNTTSKGNIAINAFSQSVSSGSVVGTISDIKFYNNTTTVLSDGDFQTNSIWEESDTGKHYIWSGSAWTEVA